RTRAGPGWPRRLPAVSRRPARGKPWRRSRGCIRYRSFPPGRSGTRRGPGTTCGIRSSRPATWLPASDVPLLLLPGVDQEREHRPVAFHLSDRGALGEDGPGGAGLHALAARRTGRRCSPGLMHIGDDAGVHPAMRDVPGVGAFDLVADPHATGTEDAAVVVDAEPLVADIHGQLGVEIVEPNVVHADPLGKVLELAVAVGHAHGTYVVALGEEKLDDHSPEVPEPLRAGLHLHFLEDLRGAGRHQSGWIADLDQAHPAGAHVGDTLEMAEGRNRDSRFVRGLENRLVAMRVDEPSVDRQGLDRGHDHRLHQ